MDRGAPLTHAGWTALHAVCWPGERTVTGEDVRAETEQIIRRLIAEGVPIDCQDANGLTPLLTALDGDEVSFTAVRTLLELGATVGACDQKGQTELHYALSSPDCIQLLLAAGADPLRPDHAGITPQALAEQSLRYYQERLERAEAIPGVRESVRRAHFTPYVEAAQKVVALLAG
ncbi:ankyrin repeat domain-containing protein [Armatimonas rosea]|uniref:Ankyrin repeat protein n=1 Tax=Armatimonas rosea TaxID=685828 RepID=A0A7W9SVL1_ARMRO|nr:ankyrin repeat domain-containing protein [Armatimonas rosea]MBB6053662.1 ankyrin repeat protein [Armatimonas rosea]